MTVRGFSFEKNFVLCRWESETLKYIKSFTVANLPY